MITWLLSKAHNRRGDCLLLYGRAQDALDAYEAALAITPDDDYVLYNRARAHLALGNPTAAKTDLNAVLDSKTSQPGARKLATKELEKLK
ncbi:MAG: tetratricopeptide repeat protein [Verrucomicrobiaceae bacterium]|nr:tetratricopeptide repeat protein [Verrucomicrobiaceae bacterium]